MRVALRRAALGLLALIALVVALALLFPRDRVDREISFQDKSIGSDPDTWLQMSEQQFPDIVPGAAKRIHWAGEKGARTPLAIVYVHGFSASAEEIRPVPDEVAATLGANLFFTRLAGHGRGSAAMAGPTAGDWIEDMAEAMAIGRRLGDRVVVIGTSTGGTLAALAAADPALSQGLAGVVLLSPNFALGRNGAFLLDLPLARWWGPLVAGRTVSWEPINADHGRYWTTSYPSTALFPMLALLREAAATDFGIATVPALILFSPQDEVIDPAAIQPVAEAWGGSVQMEPREMQSDDDPMAHIIAGDVLSPGQTEPVIALIVDWARGL